MMAVFYFTAHEKGFKFYAQPQTGAYSCSFLGRLIADSISNRVVGPSFSLR